MVMSKISTSTPDRPVLYLTMRTHDCRSLEKALHGVLQLRGRKITGGGDEWFRATREEVVAIYRAVITDLVGGA